MNEEEKETIKYFYNLRATIDESNMLFEKDINVKHGKETIRQITIILNLIENQQKELNNLKEIEKSHKEENGKLRVELEQEKEKNNELEIELSTRDNINVDKLVEKYKYYRRLADSYQANCISKDKIKEKIRMYKLVGNPVSARALELLLEEK